MKAGQVTPAVKQAAAAMDAAAENATSTAAAGEEVVDAAQWRVYHCYGEGKRTKKGPTDHFHSLPFLDLEPEGISSGWENPGR